MEIEELCYQHAPLQYICIQRPVEILGESCFRDAIGDDESQPTELAPEFQCPQVEREDLRSNGVFENVSRRKRIPDSCFQRHWPQLICTFCSIEVRGGLHSNNGKYERTRTDEMISENEFWLL
jgi:hypothetical protein